MFSKWIFSSRQACYRRLHLAAIFAFVYTHIGSLVIWRFRAGQIFLCALFAGLGASFERAQAAELDEAMSNAAVEMWESVPSEPQLRVAINRIKAPWIEIDDTTFIKLNRTLENVLNRTRPNGHKVISRGALRSVFLAIESEKLGEDPESVRLALLEKAIADAFVTPDYWVEDDAVIVDLQLISVADASILGASSSIKLPIAPSNPCLNQSASRKGYVCLTRNLIARSTFVAVRDGNYPVLVASIALVNQSNYEIGVNLAMPRAMAVDTSGNRFGGGSASVDFSGVVRCRGSKHRCSDPSEQTASDFTNIPPHSETAIIFELEGYQEALPTSNSRVSLGATIMVHEPSENEGEVYIAPLSLVDLPIGRNE